MPLRNTHRTHLGPLVVNYSADSRPASVSLKFGPTTFALWSRTKKAGLSSVDLPGSYSYRTERKAKRAPERGVAPSGYDESDS